MHTMDKIEDLLIELSLKVEYSYFHSEATEEYVEWLEDKDCTVRGIYYYKEKERLRFTVARDGKTLNDATYDEKVFNSVEQLLYTSNDWRSSNH